MPRISLAGIALMAALGLAAYFQFGGTSSQIIKLSGEAMGTTYNIVATDPSGKLQSDQVQAAVDAVLANMNDKLSNWNPNSEVSQFNKSHSTDPIDISDEFATVMAAANQVYDQSEGQFDVTLGPLIELWGFGARNADSPVPADDAIAAAMAVVGQAKVTTLSGNTLSKARPDTSIYLAAIAKGYGVDQIATALRKFDMTNYMVEIGGDLVTSGNNPDGNPWTIGIERPYAGQGTVEQVVKIADLGMATSGDYRNYFEQDGVRYSHIIDAQTGRPITHTTASVTVLAKNAMMADAWATALLALGAERGITIAQSLDLAVMFISRDSAAADMQFITTSTPQFTALQAK